MNLTRNQLIGLGATKTLSQDLTKSLAVTQKQGRANLYRLSDILQAIDQRLGNQRIRQTTRQTLINLKSALSELGSNVIEVPFGAPTTEISSAAKKLLKSAQTPATTKHKLNAAELKGKRLSHA